MKFYLYQSLKWTGYDVCLSRIGKLKGKGNLIGKSHVKKANKNNEKYKRIHKDYLLINTTF